MTRTMRMRSPVVVSSRLVSRAAGAVEHSSDADGGARARVVGVEGDRGNRWKKIMRVDSLGRETVRGVEGETTRGRRRARAMSRMTTVMVMVSLTTMRATTAARASAAEEERSFYIREYAPNEETSCVVANYGWFCEPSNIEYSNTVWDPTTTYAEDDVSETTSECVYCRACAACAIGNLTCVRANADKCFLSCTEDEVRARLAECDFELEKCVSLHHDVAREDLRASTGYVYEFYVNEFNGTDEGLGTRADPWRSLARAERRVRFLRAVTESSGYGRTLLAPVQLWIRDASSDVGLDPMDNAHNGRYSSLTYSR